MLKFIYTSKVSYVAMGMWCLVVIAICRHIEKMNFGSKYCYEK